MTESGTSVERSIRRPITEFRDRHRGEDIWVVASGSSMDYVDPAFFRNKVVIGVNEVYRHFPCTYLVRKEAMGADDASEYGVPLLISEYDCGNRTAARNSVKGTAWYYDHEHNNCTAVDLSVVGGDKIIVSYSTITSAMHIAAYMGAANIMVCGHDGGALDRRMTYRGYYPEDQSYSTWYRHWVSQIMGQSMLVRQKLSDVYGCRMYTLNPFIGFDLEGHVFSASPTDDDSQHGDHAFHRYWLAPPAENAPERHVDCRSHSRIIVDEIVPLGLDRDVRILELGCGIGRTLWALQQAGYTNLTGVDINRGALRMARTQYPGLRAHLIEDRIERFAEKCVTEFDVVFSLAALCHLPPFVGETFENIARLTHRHLLTLEDEKSVSNRHHPRPYRDVFEGLGLKQVKSQWMHEYPDTGFDSNWHLRVFARN